MKAHLWKKALALGITCSMLAGIVSPGAYANVVAEQNAVKAAGIPEPAYEYTFEDDTVSGRKIANTKSTDGAAELGGSGSTTVSDSTRGSKVLKLPGGSVGAGYLTLPDDIYSDVTDGFTISMWIKGLDNAAHYNRIFESSSTELGKGTLDVWDDPEFAIVLGGTDSSASRYVGVVNTNTGTTYKNDWSSAVGTGRWKYLTVSVTKSSYDVYLDGNKVSVTTMSGTVASALNTFFSEMDQFTHNALGRSVYTSDNDLAGLIDDFRFYNTALTEEQAVSVYTDEYKQEMGEVEYTDPTLNFDMTSNTGDMLHGSTGFLYGVSEVNVPSYDMVAGIQPQMLVQKAANGKQHPSGDAYRLTSYMQESGLQNLQIYLQDYYLEWPYDTAGIDDYKQKVINIVTEMTEDKTEEERAFYSYVLFNEPDGIWYNPMNSNITRFCNDWLTIYETVKEIDPDAKTAGPNFSVYNKGHYETFFKFCYENDCLPEMITWHDLQKGKLTAFASEYEHVLGLVDKYYAESDIEPTLFVNEIADFEDVGTPGPLVNWLSIFEEKKVYASLPYWGLANSMNELAAEANKPNGAWWVYKWYADMQGYSVAMTSENNNAPSSANKGDRLYGLTSVDENNSRVSTVFGGHEGIQVINYDELASLDMFKNATLAHVKIYKTKYTGHQGFADGTPVVYEGNLPIKNGKLQLVMKDCDLMDGYYAIITPATDDTITAIDDYVKNWTATYEAEEAELLGNAKAATKTAGGDLARSNRGEVNNTKTENDGVKFTIDVPEDGTYKVQVYYSLQAPYVNAVTLEEDASGQNRAQGKRAQGRLIVDNDASTEQILEYKSTVKQGYFNYETVYLELEEGTHTISVTHYGEDQTKKSTNVQVYGILDKMDVTYESAMGEGKKTATAEVQFEEINRDSNYKAINTTAGYEGAGYLTGKGDVSFQVIVPEDGLYQTDIIYSAAIAGKIKVTKRAMDFAEDAVATSEVRLYELPVFEYTASTKSGWQTKDAGSVFLTAGANTLTVSSAQTINLDAIHFVKDEKQTEANTVSIEAEDAYLYGEATTGESLYASNEEFVTGICGANADDKMVVKVTVPTAGNYKMSVYYANNEPAPVMKKSDGTNYVHPYNTDLVERYAQISVNGAEPETVYFRNTLAWEVFSNVVIDVKLKAGENTIAFSNDNSYKFSELQNDYTPNFDKIEVTPASIRTADTPDPTQPTTTDKPTTPVVPTTPTTVPTVPTVATVPSKSAFTSNNPGLPKGKAEESKTAVYGALSAKVTKTTKNAQTLKWKKVSGADGYVVFGNMCNTNGKKYKFQVLKVISKNSTTSFVHKKLKKGTFYKYMVQAYKVVDGKVKIVSTSKTMHSATKGGKYNNPTSIKVNKSSITLKVKKKVKIKASLKGKKLTTHRKLAYESSDKKVAAVTAQGVVQAKKKGNCIIYVYAQNGVCKEVKVKVK